jgi:hypothetical protein
MADSDRPEKGRTSGADPAHELVAADLFALIAHLRGLRERADGVSPLPFRCREGADAEFCVDLVAGMRSIEDRFIMAGWASKLTQFPLLQIPQRWDSGYNLSKVNVLQQLDRTLQLLKEQLKLADLKLYVTVADSSDVGELLKAALARKGHTQKEAAPVLDVSLDSVKGWVSGRQHPEGENIGKVAGYIASAFTSTRF